MTRDPLQLHVCRGRGAAGGAAVARGHAAPLRGLARLQRRAPLLRPAHRGHRRPLRRVSYQKKYLISLEKYFLQEDEALRPEAGVRVAHAGHLPALAPGRARAEARGGGDREAPALLRLRGQVGHVTRGGSVTRALASQVREVQGQGM